MHMYIRSFALKWCCVIANDDEKKIIISSRLGLTHILLMITKQLHMYNHAFMPAARVILYYTYVVIIVLVATYNGSYSCSILHVSHWPMD